MKCLIKIIDWRRGDRQHAAKRSGVSVSDEVFSQERRGKKHDCWMTGSEGKFLQLVASEAFSVEWKTAMEGYKWRARVVGRGEGSQNFCCCFAKRTNCSQCISECVSVVTQNGQGCAENADCLKNILLGLKGIFSRKTNNISHFLPFIFIYSSIWTET